MSSPYSGAADLASLAREFPGVPGRLPPLMALTDPSRTPDVLTFAEGLPEGCALIYRHFGRPERFDDAGRLVEIAQARKLKLLISADPELAVVAGAEGIHWPARMVHQARAWRNNHPFRVMTVSAHNREELDQARSIGADAALLSPILPTKSPNSGPVIGTLRARALVPGAKLPVYALGGIKAETVPHLTGIGFSGIAAIDGLKA